MRDRLRAAGRARRSSLLLATALVAGFVQPSPGATFSTSYIGAAGGTYNTSGNWSSGIVPTTNNPAAGDFWNVTINRAGGSNVTATGSFEVLNLTIGASNQLTIPTLSTFSILGSASAGTAAVSNSGSINLTGGAAGATLRFRSSFTNLSGSGTINITGPAVVRGEGGTLVTSNRIIGSGTIGVGSLAVTNDGTILAQGGVLNLLPHPTAGFTNQNLMSAAASSTLRLGAGTYTNAGTIQALGMGTVAVIDAARVNGGTISLAPTAALLVQTPSATFSAVQIVNNGSIFLNSPGVASEVRISGLLTGSGITTLSGVPGATLTLGGLGNASLLTNESTILGNGRIGAAGFGTFINAGTVTATQPGHDLSLGNGASVQNIGTITASAGTIRLATTSGQPFISAGASGTGTISASGTGSIQFSSNVTLVGQTLIASGAGTFAPVPAGGALTLDRVTNNATLTHGGGTLLIVSPSITNNGVLTMRTDGSVPGLVRLSNNSTVTFNGTGRLVLDALSTTATPRIENVGTGVGTLVNTAAHTIEGEGFLGNSFGSLAIRNEGIIEWNANTIGMRIFGGGSTPLVNAGLITAKGAVPGAALTIDTANGVTNSGGKIRTFGASTLQFNGGGTITGGTIETISAGSSIGLLGGGTLTLAGVTMTGQGTISGTSTLVNAGGTVSFSGERTFLNPLLINNGTVICTGGTLSTGPGTVIQNNGTIASVDTLSLPGIGTLTNNGWINALLADVHVESGTRIDGVGTLLSEGSLGGRFIFRNNPLIIGNTLIGDSLSVGDFEIDAGHTLTLQDARIFIDTILRAAGAGTLGVNGIVDNEGVVRGAANQTLTLRTPDGATGQLAGAGEVRTGAGGTLVIAGTGTLQSANFLNLGGNSALSILSPALINDGSISAATDISGSGSTVFRNNGSIFVTGATSLSLAQPVENGGRITVSSGGTLTLNAHITGGTITNAGSRIQPVGTLRDLTGVQLVNNNVGSLTGVVDTAGTGLRLTNATVTNAGFIGPFGGSGGSVEFIGGTITNTGTISRYALRSGASISGGTLTGLGTVSLGSIGNVANTGTITVSTVGFLTLTGNVSNNGWISLSSSAMIVGGTTVTLSGSGSLLGVSSAQIIGNGTLVNGATHVITGGDSFTVGDGTLNIRNAGVIRAVGSLNLIPGPAGLTNSGSIIVEDLGTRLRISPGVIHNTGGVLNAISGLIELNNVSVIGGQLMSSTGTPPFLGGVSMSLTGPAGSGTLTNVSNSGFFNASSIGGDLPLHLVGTIHNTGDLFLSTRVEGAAATVDGAGSITINDVDVAIGTITGMGIISLNNSAGGRTATLTSTQIRASSLTLETFGSASFGFSTARVNLGSSPSDISRVGSIALLGAGTAILNLSASTLVYDYTGATPFASVRQQIVNGYNGGSWNGSGIISEAATSPGLAVGFAEASDIFTTFPAVFAGESIDNTALLLRLTLEGDANLDRIVNIGDFSLLASNFNQSSYWARGDFNYDGTTGIGDFALLAANFNQSLPAEPARVAVPEPAGALTMVALSMIALRRRHSHI